MNTYEYTVYSSDHLGKELGTSLTQGLTNKQILDYQKKYGVNEIEGKGSSTYALLWRQFKSPFTYLLLGAAFLSLIVGDMLNACIILLIVVINALLSFYQEYRAEQALKLLRTHLVMKAKVIRNGQDIVVSNTELVPGDIIKLQPGDYIPADIRFIDGSAFVDESALTGESAPVKKISTPLNEVAQDVYHALNLGLLGTTVTAGSASAIVLATGTNTLFGTISTLSLQTIRESGFQQALVRLSSFILALICITLVGLFLFHLILKGSNINVMQLLLFCIAIALGMTPEALPTVTTFALSRGALQLARHNVVVKRLAAIEDLGAINILCTDKTGTLTENKLSVSSIYETADKNLLLFALLASKKQEPLDPFDHALWASASEEIKKHETDYKRIKETPFDPAKRRNSVIVQINSDSLLISRGAYESIKSLCSLSNEIILKSWIEEQSAQGNRILAVAYKKVSNQQGEIEEHDMTMAGLIAFQDPIKKTASAAIAKARELGITLKMITGDSKEVACAVAQAVGLTDNPDCAITGAEFEALSLEEKQLAVVSYSVFARIVPEQKYAIVNLLKESFHGTVPDQLNIHSSGKLFQFTPSKTNGKQAPIVGYLGEGINDAPALKAAHVGLAVQGASDIAQDAADIILLQKSLMVIVEGIALGRNVFSNTLKYIVATISSNFGNIYSLSIASLMLDFLPMLPLQVLLINLLSDFPMVAIATDTVDQDELKKAPEFSLKGIGFLALILGFVSSLFDFVFFAFFSRLGPSVLQTNWFIGSILTELALIYSVRTKKLFFKARSPSFALISLSLISATIAITLTYTRWGQEFFHFQAPTPWQMFTIASIVAAYFVTTECVKLLYFAMTNSVTPKHAKHHRSKPPAS